MLTETRIAVRYPDADPMGIVHHAVYPIWYEIARMDFFEKAGFSYTDMNARGINPPMVNLNLNYYAPVRYPGEVTVRTVCTLCEGKKLELRYSVYPDGASTPVASATSFHVWTGPDMKSLDMRTLPEVYEKLQNAVTRPAVLILAGGRSTRMGVDKAKVKLAGIPMLQRAADYWHTALPGSTIYISVGPEDHLPDLPEDTYPVADLVADKGPMGGLHAAFTQTGESLLCISAVDMPTLSLDAIHLLEQKRCHGEDICIFSNNGRPEPLFGFYRDTCLPIIEELLSEGDHRMSSLIDRCRTTLVPLKDTHWVMNVNTPQELQEAASHL